MQTTIKKGAFALAIFLIFSLALRAQTETLTLVPSNEVPQQATFFSAQNRPPLPYDWMPDLEVYSLGNGQFVVDDRSVIYSTPGPSGRTGRRAGDETATPANDKGVPSPSNAGGNGTSPISLLAQAETNPPVPPEDLPRIGTFYSAQNRPPLPYDWLPDLQVYPLGNGQFVVDDSSVNYSAAGTQGDVSRPGGEAAASMDDSGAPLPPGDGGGGTNSFGGGGPYPVPSFSTNGLWMQITGITHGIVSLNLNNAADTVYEVWSKTNLNQTNWNIETEVFPTNQQVMPFTIAGQGRGNLFVWARDWTGITSNGNETPEWWFWEYFGTVDLSDTNLDVNGVQTLLFDYTNHINPTNYSGLWLEALPSGTNAYNSDTNSLTFILHGTTDASSYQLQSTASLTATDWTPQPPISGASGQDWTPITFPLSGQTALFFRAIYCQDSTGSGLADWWCLEYFGTLDVDPYADDDNDGLCNLDKYLLGICPTNANAISPLHNNAQALFLAYTNDPACYYQLFVTNGPDTNTALVTMWPTAVGTNYQIYTCLQGDPTLTWRVETNYLGTNTATTVAIALNGRSLNFIGGYGEDSDGDGLPDGYEVLATLTDPYLPDTGLTGTPDGYKDPDGDGYSNLQEMYNGTNPHVFDTPVGAQDLFADYTDGTNEIVLSWEPAGGSVSNYVVWAYNRTLNTEESIATTSSTQLSCILTDLADYTGGWGPEGVNFYVQANYANGTTTYAAPTTENQVLSQAAIVSGLEGKTYLLTSLLTSNLAGYIAEPDGFGATFPEATAYFQSAALYPTNSDLYSSNIYIPASQFTNGVAVLSDAQDLPFSFLEAYFLNPLLQGGAAGFNVGAVASGLNMPFIDGTAQMKQNIQFLLRAAGNAPFGYEVHNFNPSWPETYLITYPSNYVYSSLYYFGMVGGGEDLMDHFAPFEDNYFYRNFVFDPIYLDSNGNLKTGFSPWESTWWPCNETNNNPAFMFPTFDYVVSSNLAPIPCVLPSGGASSVGYFDGSVIGAFGVSNSGSGLVMWPVVNVYGLSCDSLVLTLTNGFQTMLSPGGYISGWNRGSFYPAAAEPVLQTVGYYFGRPFTDPMNYYAANDPLPGLESFNVTNTTPLMIGSVGNPMLIAGYAKQAVLNGSPNVFAYLGQYFTNAFLMSNGVVTTNPAGILSEYGEFFPTVPGQVALLTMPDPDQNYMQGTCVVDIIRLSLDVNHDGIMNETYTGPDNGSYTLWANNDYDRYTGGGEDDLQTASQPDYNYTIGGYRAIPCPRDLEDYARLWVSGVSNTLSRLPTGSTVTLSWAPVNYDSNGNPTEAGSPTIDLFQAADPDGGIGYLTNLATATNQLNNTRCQYVGRLGPGSNIVLNSSSYSNGWAGDHYIWCGVFQGSGTLTLTISDGSGNLLAQSSQSIQIQDIKQMYERWTVGDSPDTAPGAPMSSAVPAEDNFSPGYPAQYFTYSYDPDYDTNDAYIVCVHGWNKLTWQKDRDAETMYKRLYWQGYQGRFGEFRWPCNLLNLNTLLLALPNFDLGEWTAWQCGQPFETFLAGLNSKYPGNVYVLAHSMGNVVTGEALRLAGTSNIVNTYVATQAAISAHDYDNTIAQDVPYRPATPDSEGHYYTNGAPPYFNSIGGASHFVDYYNYNDSVLSWWITDQQIKPDVGYQYETPSQRYPSGYYYQVGIQQPRPLLFPTNTYEIFARAVPSYSFPLGAETNIAATFPSSLAVNLHAAPYNFGTQHSLQFRSDNMTTAVYWHQLLISFGINH
ncbi:MAG: hypothetical protein ABSA83_13555 [Verrucomicrobiota bacterium]|jgi:hypothetical protein